MITHRKTDKQKDSMTKYISSNCLRKKYKIHKKYLTETIIMVPVT